MSHEIIKQPNGRFAVWSTVVDDFVLKNATPLQLIKFDLKNAKERITREITEIVKSLNETGKYWHFRTWEDALKTIEEMHGGKI